jgi:hypothetical protein
MISPGTQRGRNDELVELQSCRKSDGEAIQWKKLNQNVCNIVANGIEMKLSLPDDGLSFLG